GIVEVGGDHSRYLQHKGQRLPAAMFVRPPGSWQHAGREPPASPSSRGPIPPLRHGRCRGGGRRREPFDDEDLAVEIDDVEVADLVDTEADDAVVATGVGSEVGIAYGELRARYRRPLRHLRDRERPDIRR